MKAGCPGVRAHVHAPPIHHPCLLPQSLPYILIQLPAPRGIGLQGRGQSLLLLSMLGLPRVVVLEGEVETAERDKQRGEVR